MKKSNPDRKEIKAYVISVFTGVILWLSLSIISAPHEAWDNALYWPSIFILYIICGFVGFKYPRKFWRWGIIPFAAQAVIAIVQNPTANLLPLGLAVFFILSVPGILASYIGVIIAKRLKQKNL